MIISRRLYERIFNYTVDVKVTIGGTTYRCQGYINNPWIRRSDDDNFTLDINPPSFGNYFDLRKGEISYHAGEQELNEEGKWKREGRQVCKASKLISHIMVHSRVEIWYNDCYVPSSERENIDKKIRQRLLEIVSTLTSIKGSEIKTSDDPLCIYSMETHPGTGTLASSCMRPESGCECREYAGFYNHMKARIAYMLSPVGTLFSRALLWENVKDIPSGKIFSFMDRIYGTEECVEEMKQWAHQNGYGHKTEQSYSNSEIILPDGERVYDFMYEVDSDYFDGFPYVDTLYNLNVENGKFLLYSQRSGEHDLQDTEGENVLDSNDHFECSDCGRHLDADDANWIGDSLYCSSCSKYSNYDDRYYRTGDVVWSEHMGDYIYYGDAIEVEGDYIHQDSDDYVEVNGTNYFTNSSRICKCDHCGEYHLSREVNYSNVLEEDLCEDCWNDAHEEEGYVLIDGEWKKDEEIEKEETVKLVKDLPSSCTPEQWQELYNLVSIETPL